MQNTDRTPSERANIRIERIDPTNGNLMNSWKFLQRDEITIGRSAEQDVEIHDPYVSRHHASLVLREGKWMLVSHGRNGVMVGMQIVEEYETDGELEFRLGPKGPLLRFAVAYESMGRTNLGTIVFDHPIQLETLDDDVPNQDLFNLDHQRLQQEVSEIAESDYFQKLQKLASEMRRRRDT